jgi:hypothetical protein
MTGLEATTFAPAARAKSWNFSPPSRYRSFLREVATADLPTPLTEGARVTEADLAELPAAAQRYMRFMGVVGRPRDWSFVVRFHGRFRRRPGEAWMPCDAWQYNSMFEVARIFVMRIRFAHVLSMVGRDTYIRGHGRMRGKLLGLVTVVDGHGEEFDIGELGDVSERRGAARALDAPCAVDVLVGGRRSFLRCDPHRRRSYRDRSCVARRAWRPPRLPDRRPLRRTQRWPRPCAMDHAGERVGARRRATVPWAGVGCVAAARRALHLHRGQLRPWLGEVQRRAGRMTDVRVSVSNPVEREDHRRPGSDPVRARVRSSSSPDPRTCLHDC